MTSRPTKPIRRRRDYATELRVVAVIALVGGAVVGGVLWLRQPRIVPSVAVVAPPPPPPPVKPAPAHLPETDNLLRATIGAPASIAFGDSISARWTGPDNPADFVTLVKPDTPPTIYGEKHPTKDGWRMTFAAPDESGPWELRYIAGRAKKILGQTTVVVRPRVAELAATDQAIIGTEIAVRCTTVSRPGDCLTIVSSDTPDGTFETVTAVNGAASVQMTVPLEPGDAEIRYMTKDHEVLGRRPLTITIPITSLFAPDEVVAGATFEVRWNGPNRPTDEIRLVPLPPSTTSRPHFALTANGSPVNLKAPAESGRAELRYVIGPKSLILARRPIQILPKP
ncbi:MAG: hypothetical protein ABI222_17345 [Opitutaceae bacterium]